VETVGGESNARTMRRGRDNKDRHVGRISRLGKWKEDNSTLQIHSIDQLIAILHGR